MDALRGRTEGFLPVDQLPGVRSFARGSLILAVVLLATLADGCQRGAGQSAAVDGHKDGKAAPHFVMTPDTPYVTIFVTTLGNIEVNGKPADLQAVAGAFTGDGLKIGRLAIDLDVAEGGHEYGDVGCVRGHHEMRRSFAILMAVHRGRLAGPALASVCERRQEHHREYQRTPRERSHSRKLIDW